MGWLAILQPGARTLVQDLGFRDGRGLGVPPGGVMDRAGLRLLNALLGDPAGTEVLEVTLTGPTLLAEGGAVRLALSGTLAGRITTPDGATRPLPPWTATTLAEGERLSVGTPAPGPYGMIGIAGGIDVPRILGSRSTCLRAGFGGWQGRALVAGDRLETTPSRPDLPNRRLSAPPDATGPIRVVPGPQAEWFGSEGLAVLCAAPYTVTAECDRMGLRLEGASLPFTSGYSTDILSDGIVPGAMQVPGSGQPIILLADAQTTGGYAKIATVIGADLPRLSRLAPGGQVRFRPVTVAEGEAAAREAATELAAACASIENVGSLADLLSANLIGGVVDMARPDHFDGHLPSTGRKAGST